MYFIYMKAHFDSHKYVHLALIIDLKCGIVFTFSLLTYVLTEVISHCYCEIFEHMF